MRTLIDEILEMETPTNPPRSRKTLAQERKDVASDYNRGIYDENVLTDRVFYSRHPERKGRRISRTEPNFKQLRSEWLFIRDKIVWPTICSISECIFVYGTAPRK